MMMQARGRLVEADRLVDLERTVEALNGQLRDMQGERCGVKAELLSVRWWRTLVPHRGDVFMSAVCNRRIRPNTKVVAHGGSRA
jgi:hypothetical protein